MTTGTAQLANRDTVANTNSQNDKLITVAEVAELLVVSQTTIYNWSNPTSPDRLPGFPHAAPAWEQENPLPVE